MINELKNFIRSSVDFNKIVPISDVSNADPLAQSLMRLDRLRNILRLLGAYILVCTVVNIGTCVGIAAGLQVFTHGTTWVLSSAVSAGVAILFASIYDMLRRQGDAVFEEVSDELQWKILRKEGNSENGDAFDKSTSKYVGKRPELNVRITLRTYARASELPFIPGKYGAVSYVLINLALVIINGIVISATARGH